MLHHMTADLIMQFTAVNTLTWAYSLIIEDIPPPMAVLFRPPTIESFEKICIKLIWKKLIEECTSSLFQTQIWMF